MALALPAAVAATADRNKAEANLKAIQDRIESVSQQVQRDAVEKSRSWPKWINSGENVSDTKKKTAWHDKTWNDGSKAHRLSCIAGFCFLGHKIGPRASNTDACNSSNRTACKLPNSICCRHAMYGAVTGAIPCRNFVTARAA